MRKPTSADAVRHVHSTLIHSIPLSKPLLQDRGADGMPHTAWRGLKVQIGSIASRRRSGHSVDTDGGLAVMDSLRLH